MAGPATHQYLRTAIHKSFPPFAAPVRDKNKTTITKDQQNHDAPYSNTAVDSIRQGTRAHASQESGLS
jgi:hypothetical protein